MAGKIIKYVSQTVTAGTSTGYATVGSVTGFYKKAFGTLSKSDYPSLDVQVTEILTGTNQLGLRRVRGPGEGQNYGRDSMVSYAPEIRLSYNTLTLTFNVGATVTGGTSGATGTIVSISVATGTTGYLVISGVAGTFQAAENITDNGGIPGAAKAVGAQATVSATVSLQPQVIYNSNDKPLA